MKNLENINFKYIWELPQSLLALILIKVLKAKKRENNGFYYFKSRKLTHFSLGKFIFINSRKALPEWKLKHEQGHSRQSEILGPLYLIVIGLPSVVWNCVSRHIKVSYYSFYTEKWANKLGGVE